MWEEWQEAANADLLEAMRILQTAMVHSVIMCYNVDMETKAERRCDEVLPILAQ